jgi:hypothetical protein
MTFDHRSLAPCVELLADVDAPFPAHQPASPSEIRGLARSTRRTRDPSTGADPCITERAEAWAQASSWRIDRTERTTASVEPNGGDGRQDDEDAKRRARLDDALGPCHPVVRRATAEQE